MAEPEDRDGMKLRDIILLLIARGEGRSEFGRTSLQKLGYFAGRALGRDLGHRAHFYGPFASAIERETGNLVLSNLVEENVRSLGFANSSGFEARQFTYTLTNAGRERVAALESRNANETKIINDLVAALLELSGTLDQRVLSAAAKVDFIAIQQDRPVSVDDVRLAATDLGWTLSESQVEAVVDLLSKLGFVQVTSLPEQ